LLNSESLSVRARVLARGRRTRADLALFSTSIIWGSAFVAQRVAAAHVGPFLYNGIRFLLGALVLLPLVWWRGRAVRGTLAAARQETCGGSKAGTMWRGGVLAGLILVGAAVLQQAGLAYTTAGKAGFITGLYVVLVPLFLAVGWRQWPRPLAWVAPLLAAGGLYLLSMVGRFSISLGDGLELLGACLWACHVILIDRLVGQVDGLRLALVQYLACGTISLFLGFGLEAHTLGGLGAAWGAVVYGGVISVGLGYTLQVIGQQDAPATDAVLMLSLEAVFAALFGWFLLGETLTRVQVLGCVLMIGGMLLAQFPALQAGDA
jgi:drug/metabolite transporter (DMT)-like permease